MRYGKPLGWSMVVILGAVASTCAQAGETAPPAQGEKATTAMPLDSVLGKKLTGIDGTTIELSSANGSFSRELSSPNGAVQRLKFSLINSRLGTVSDANDSSSVTGLFRATEQEIFVHYADGAAELLRQNTAGGLSIETKATDGTFSCRSFYPEGHVFSLDERKAALAEFAGRLGLADLATNTAVAKPQCGVAIEGRLPSPPATDTPAAAESAGTPRASQVQAAGPQPTLAPVITLFPAPSNLPSSDSAAAAAVALLSQLPATGTRATSDADSPVASEKRTPEVRTASALPAGQVINVRPSQVQPVDKAPDSGPSSPLKPTESDSAAESGASSCLSVESDGMHWGFRNQCGYDVQFAYCTMDGRNPLTGCRERAVGGSVAPNSFGVLVVDENLKAVNARHDFRWVACKGGAGEVIARLDQVDPPSGRCIR
jgi:hypothetical protein